MTAGEPELDVFLSGTVFLDLVFSGLRAPPAPGTEVLCAGLGSAPGGCANLAVALAQLKSLYTTGTRLTLALLMPMTCTLLVLGGTILSVWVGPAYADYEPIVRILVLAALASTSQGPAVSVLKGVARHRPLAISAICSRLVNLGLSIALIRPFGLEGVALGTLVPTVAESLGVVFPYALWVLLSPNTQRRPLANTSKAATEGQVGS